MSLTSINWPPKWAKQDNCLLATPTPASCLPRLCSTLNLIQASTDNKAERVFYSFSACIYPAYNQENADNQLCAEGSAYLVARIANIVGRSSLANEFTYISATLGFKHGLHASIISLDPRVRGKGSRKSRPLRFVERSQKQSTTPTEIWVDGKQTRSFIYIDQCVEGIRRFVESAFTGPINIG